MPESLLIRVDSNPEIASGHLMRCLSIADEARTQGLEVIFLMSDDQNRRYVQQKGFGFHNLDTDWRCLDSEITKMKEIILSTLNPILLIDTYSISATYVTPLQEYLPVIYLGSKMTDIGQPDGIVNYSSHIDYQFYEENFTNSELLLGMRYAPLRSEFKNQNPLRSEVLNDILVTVGGTDKPGFSLHFIQSNLNLFEILGINCHIVIGAMFDNLDQFEEIQKQSSRIKLHHNVFNMEELMINCQLAISANGTTVYELAACGIPTVSFALVDEQEISGTTLGKMGIVDYCGLYTDNKSECLKKISERVEYYSRHPEERLRLGERAYSIIDGKGCEYIVDLIKKIRKEW